MPFIFTEVEAIADDADISTIIRYTRHCSNFSSSSSSESSSIESIWLMFQNHSGVSEYCCCCGGRGCSGSDSGSGS
jgi:hypothetical protein